MADATRVRARCPECGCAEALAQGLAQRAKDTRKGEVWGNKEAESLSTQLQCTSCQHRWMVEDCQFAPLDRAEGAGAGSPRIGGS